MDIERKRFLSKIARLYYLEGLTQQDIANKLSISRTRVSRYLTLARKENIVEININYPSEDFSHMEYHIEKKYHLKECIIVDAMESREAVIKSMGDSFNGEGPSGNYPII